ncbi:hypothetical protein C0J52_05207 [Blattella germanica]|nr:hypothetical protein C0J52_05207 [Blattella germanica]
MFSKHFNTNTLFKFVVMSKHTKPKGRGNEKVQLPTENSAIANDKLGNVLIKIQAKPGAKKNAVTGDKNILNKKLAGVQGKAQCVEWFIETSSHIQVQRRFRTQYRRQPSIRKWYNNFMQTGGVDVKYYMGMPRKSTDNTERIQLSFQRSPQKSIQTASQELHIPRLTVHRVLRKRLSLYPYRLQLKQALKLNDRSLRMQFVVDILSRIEDYNNF